LTVKGRLFQITITDGRMIESEPVAGRIDAF
jgi:hypothetical protein